MMHTTSDVREGLHCHAGSDCNEPQALSHQWCAHLIRGLVWTEDEATSSVLSSSRALMRSSSRDTSRLRSSSRLKNDAEAA